MAILVSLADQNSKRILAHAVEGAHGEASPMEAFVLHFLVDRTLNE